MTSSAFPLSSGANTNPANSARDSLGQTPLVIIPLRYAAPRALPEISFSLDAYAYTLEEELDVLKTHRLGLPYILAPLDAESGQDAALDFSHYLRAAADEFEQRRILYRSIPLSDCSGMFHRLLEEMKEAFPDYRYPSVMEARSSRALAQWYSDREALEIIDDAAQSGHLIKPGAVMFFGQIGKKYQQPSIGQLVIPGAGIQHIGTVVEVDYDEAGQVVGYTMFHARGKGKIASKTKHYLKRPSNPTLPAFGNWRQQWVAVAYIDTEPESRHLASAAQKSDD